MVLLDSLLVSFFLDVTFNLSNGTHCPYKKPNDKPLYINTKSNHPPTIIKHLPAAISRRISDISCNEEVFEKAKPYYEEALKSSGYNEKLSYDKKPSTRRKNRKRKVIWFNPPFSKHVQTNIRKTFLRLIKKHFPKTHKFNQIFNKNNVKVSYSCMENMASIIKKHNKKFINNNPVKLNNGCNCRKKDQCPIQNKCLSTSLVYNAHVTSDENTPGKDYIGLTEGTFKQRFYNHQLSFRNTNYAKSTELSKHIWSLKGERRDYRIKWTIVTSAAPYNNVSKRCNLCLTEKLKIIDADKSNLLNKRSELISKCRHENKFYIMNYKEEAT